MTDIKSIINHVKLGVDNIFFYPYNEGKYPLPLRPISSFELDTAFYNSLEYAPGKIGGLVVKLRVGLIKGDRNINISNEGYKDLLKFYDNVNYWIVYFSMKDFQPKKFSEPDYERNGHPKGYFLIKEKMQKVHEIADYIMNGSYQTEEVIKEVFEDTFGKEIGFCVYYLNQPLNKIGKLTELQKDFLIYTKIHLDKWIKGKSKEKSYIVSNKPMSMKEFLERFS